MKITKKTILVTGAAGFIGSNLLNKISTTDKYNIVAVWHNHPPCVEHDSIKYVKADLRNLSDCERILQDIDYVFMLAGRLSTTAIMNHHPLGPITENTTIHLNMLHASYRANIEKYIWLSSTTGYPEYEHPLEEDEFFLSEPPSLYKPVGWMSRYIEKVCSMYVEKCGYPSTIISLRPTAVYGPFDDFDYDTCHALPALVRRFAEHHNPVDIWGTGEDLRDWLFIDDLVDACLNAMEMITGYDAVNIGSGKPCTLNQIASYLVGIADQPNIRLRHLGSNRSSTLRRQINCSYASKRINYCARTDIQSGLRKTFEWYKSNL
jgi:GDP-L-fucose synthase